jgi:hypothetical protein
MEIDLNLLEVLVERGDGKLELRGNGFDIEFLDVSHLGCPIKQLPSYFSLGHLFLSLAWGGLVIFDDLREQSIEVWTLLRRLLGLVGRSHLEVEGLS